MEKCVGMKSAGVLKTLLIHVSVDVCKRLLKSFGNSKFPMEVTTAISAV